VPGDRRLPLPVWKPGLPDVRGPAHVLEEPFDPNDAVGDPVGVIDVGSNSGRVVVLRARAAGYLEVLADGRAPFRLASELDRSNGDRGRLSRSVIERAALALRDFRALAESTGARDVVAVATSAVREASNAADLVARAREVAGVEVSVIDGDLEARHAFAGAINELPVDHGMVMDMGGGSLEVTTFQDRHPERSWTLPLGALRLSDRFLRSDPPASREVEELRRHVASVLSDAKVPALEAAGRLVATGGSVRNLAKMDRHARTYPIPRLHGYVLTRGRLESMADRLASRRASRRGQISGLNADRVDSIVGGAFAALVTMLHVSAAEIWVSGQGLREGVALNALGVRPAPVEAVRRASVVATASRFATWDPARARRRARVALRLSAALDPDAGPKGRELLEHAATLLDVGRSLDYYRRFEHTSDVITNGDLAGFTHRRLAQLAAIVRFAGSGRPRMAEYRPLLTAADRPAVARAAAILELADEIDHRLPEDDDGAVEVDVGDRTVMLAAPLFDPWLQEYLGGRFSKVFRRRLRFRDPLAGSEPAPA
jgi:exopolyphosphatase / guanosine-5'-triphosphate,3'-diphosphate pyrophosphatase